MSRWLWTAELWTPVASSDRQYIAKAPRDAGHGGRGAGPGVASLTDRLQEGLQLLGPGGVPELPQRLRLDLADPFPRHVAGAADLLEGVLRAVADSEAHLQDLLLSRRQG